MLCLRQISQRTTAARNFFNYIIDEDRDTIQQNMAKAINEKKDIEYDYTIQTPGGKEKILSSRGKIITNDAGEAIKIIGSIRDITKEKLFERELQKTIKDLDTSNKELEEFAYIASHDLQEPLRKITTFSSRLSEKV